MDDKDKLILEILLKNPEVSQHEIAKLVGLSQPSVGARIKRMMSMGIIDHAYGINIKVFGFYILKVDVKCKQPKDLLKLFEDCPFFLNGFIVSGNKNLSMMFIGENLPTLEALVDHVRTRPDVYDIDVGIVVRAVRDIIVPLKIHVKHADTPTCGFQCEDCDYWYKRICLGCPVTGHYKGKIWKKKEQRQEE